MKKRYILVACLSAALRAQAQEIPASGFGPQQSLTTAASGARSVYASDLDGDGDLDVLSASSYDNKIAWYENKGDGSFGEQQVISTEADRAFDVYAADLDNDGDLDVLSASATYGYDDKIAWYENQGNGHFGEQQVISTQNYFAWSVYTADLDNDGDLDVLSASSGYKGIIAWYENEGSGSFGAQQIITTEANGAFSVYAVDLDQDGDLDVLSASFYDNKIAWYENDGSGNFGDQQAITTEAVNTTSVYASDLDQDGDLDVLSASIDDDKVAWYENDGNGNFGTQQIITTQADGANAVYAADLDQDGDMDVLSASLSYTDQIQIAWYENEGSGNFADQQIITTEANVAQDVYAADLDNDGDLDVLSASLGDDKIAWYENEGDGSFGEQQPLTTPASGALDVYASDLDQDGDMDVLFASGSFSYNKIAWYENEGSGHFGTQQIITTEADGATSVYAADLDNDGDTDVLSASRFDDKIAWYENQGTGNFREQLVTTDAYYTQAVYAADLDNDGDMDVLSASGNFVDGRITWYENDGSGNFAEQQLISTEVVYPL